MLGREQDAFQHVTENLQAALEKPVNLVQVHVGDDGYDFVRNLAATGPNGTMLVSRPEHRAHFGQGQDVSTTALQSAFSRMKMQVRSLDFAVNFANVCFDQHLDLLVLALPAPLELACSWVHPTLGCEKEIGELVKAFGSPTNVVKFEPAKLVKDQCYDLDMFFFLLRNADNKAVALLYSPCIAGVEGAEFKRRLKALDIAIVEVSKADFNRRACNSISPEPGQIVFSEPVSKSLTKALEKLRVSSAVLPQFISGREFGIHCLTLELPEVTIHTGKRDL